MLRVVKNIGPEVKLLGLNPNIRLPGHASHSTFLNLSFLTHKIEIITMSVSKGICMESAQQSLMHRKCSLDITIAALTFIVGVGSTPIYLLIRLPAVSVLDTYL